MLLHEMEMEILDLFAINTLKLCSKYKIIYSGYNIDIYMFFLICFIFNQKDFIFVCEHFDYYANQKLPGDLRIKEIIMKLFDFKKTAICRLKILCTLKYMQHFYTKFYTIFSNFEENNNINFIFSIQNFCLIFISRAIFQII